jgi:threonine aldolase
MRQSGILAAGALYAVQNHRGRLADDHEHAKLFANELRALLTVAGVTVQEPETNIVNIDLPAEPARRAILLAKERGVLVGPMLATRLRAVFHLDVTRAAALEGARTLARALETSMSQ